MVDLVRRAGVIPRRSCSVQIVQIGKLPGMEQREESARGFTPTLFMVECQVEIRRISRIGKVVEVAGVEVGVLETSANLLGARVFWESLDDPLAEAVGELDQVDREIILMRNVEGFSQREIAIVLELSHDAVRKRYGRALVKLQRLLAAKGLVEDEP